MKNFLWIVCVCLLSACASGERFTIVDSSNGINRYEAILIGKSEIENAGLKNYYQNLNPIVREDKYAAQYPDYWFVDFTPKIYFDFWGYLVVINKKSGEILHSRDYYFPYKVADLDWVFNKS